MSKDTEVEAHVRYSALKKEEDTTCD